MLKRFFNFLMLLLIERYKVRVKTNFSQISLNKKSRKPLGLAQRLKNSSVSAKQEIHIIFYFLSHILLLQIIQLTQKLK